MPPQAPIDTKRGYDQKNEKRIRKQKGKEKTTLEEKREKRKQQNEAN